MWGKVLYPFLSPFPQDPFSPFWSSHESELLDIFGISSMK
ncbi:hypothetical protein GXM_08966 [Nostoc sphaeroides CCNUC1]|uniref:Uncharacterized protein n=1 Tax=Nostoc sphaeroides CCNUC1 TaxID=2653204 RepID=A0A5P8WG26_9NOSO|nr:hypothetical protein GXM_08966 [Nostoc sphaeroides CCNUC1]